MLCTDARLREAMAELSPAKDLRPDLADRVRAAIAPVNVAGLADPGKRNWYGIDVEETVAAAAKLVAAPDRIRAMFSASLV